ncbi:MAG: alpha/beta fold hydrolase [Candidatus Accumulibacter sp.]|jgi:homoserine O-acetyltransferase|nr:alpha/beta fold hydrolase [Accumulibacter sp.]
MSRIFFSLLLAMSLTGATSAGAASYPEPREASFVLKDFKFHTGEVLPEVRINYLTLGNAQNPAVLILHGTAGSGQAMLRASFAEELFGPGQPLDTAKYFIILPDAIGTGKSTKPSDGLKGKFPLYNYDDMVLGQYRLLTEGLNVKHLRIIVGNSMGGMQTWLWAVSYPDFMDAVVPMASQPTAMASRNWMLRRMITDAVRNDPAWKNGEYTEQPQYFRQINVYYGMATNGGNLAYQAKAPTREKADQLYASMLANPTKLDANDFLYQWDSSRDYDPEPKLGNIKARVLVINSADDERNPPESGLTENAVKKIPKASLYLIPGSATTAGHGTVMDAKLWKSRLIEFLGTL